MTEPELEYISVKGFKSINSIEKLPLRAINVLIGPNGSGKSNFIGVFAFLHAIRDGHLRDYVQKAGGADELLHFGSKESKEIHFHIWFQHETNQYELTLAPTDIDRLYPSRELVYFWDKGTYKEAYNEFVTTLGSEAGISNQNSTGIANWVRTRLGRWRVYHFHDTSARSPMKKDADVHDNRFLRHDGSNLAAFLYYLSKKHEGSYNLIKRTVQMVTPFLDDFVLEPLSLNPDKIRLEWKHQKSDKYFHASSLSDGTLRFIALATLFLQPEDYRRSVVIVDEPELGLHPYAITILGSLVKSASEKTQVILSTQSPLLLDQFEPEDVLVADQIEGSTLLRRLESDNLASWLKDYSLGELWEKNELGGRP